MCFWAFPGLFSKSALCPFHTGFGEGLLNYICAYFQLLCGKHLLWAFLGTTLASRCCICCLSTGCVPSAVSPQILEQMTLKEVAEFVLAVAVPLPYPGSQELVFVRSHGVLAVCVQQRSCSVPLHVGTRSCSCCPSPRRDPRQQLWAQTPGESRMAGEGCGALQSSRMLLGAGLLCWKVAVWTWWWLQSSWDVQGSRTWKPLVALAVVWCVRNSVMGAGLSSATPLLSVLSLVTVLPRLECVFPLHGDFFVMYWCIWRLADWQLYKREILFFHQCFLQQG